jgi:hypothetical protein
MVVGRKYIRREKGKIKEEKIQLTVQPDNFMIMTQSLC